MDCSPPWTMVRSAKGASRWPTVEPVSLTQPSSQVSKIVVPASMSSL
jgi:hypothetical protein